MFLCREWVKENLFLHLGLTLSKLNRDQVNCDRYDQAVAIPAAIASAGITIDDVDLFELNEAFASQVGLNMYHFFSTLLCLWSGKAGYGCGEGCNHVSWCEYGRNRQQVRVTLLSII